jgi:hypothetical protein
MSHLIFNPQDPSRMDMQNTFDEILHLALVEAFVGLSRMTIAYSFAPNIGDIWQDATVFPQLFILLFLDQQLHFKAAGSFVLDLCQWNFWNKEPLTYDG